MFGGQVGIAGHITIGLRASKEEEIRGLDIMEHGLSSAYAGFEFGGMDFVDGDVDVIGSESMEVSVPALVKTSDAGDGKKITKVEILMKQERFERFKKAMNDIGVTGMTVTQVLGCGTQKGVNVGDCLYKDISGPEGTPDGVIDAYDQTVGKVMKWAAEDGETLVVVTADHETKSKWI